MATWDEAHGISGEAWHRAGFVPSTMPWKIRAWPYPRLPVRARLENTKKPAVTRA